MRLTHTIKSYDNSSDTAEIEIAIGDHIVEINLIEDHGKTSNGAEVDEGYCRTVRLEVRNGELLVMIYPTNTDDPTNIRLAMDDLAPRIED